MLTMLMCFQFVTYSVSQLQLYSLYLGLYLRNIFHRKFFKYKTICVLNMFKLDVFSFVTHSVSYGIQPCSYFGLYSETNLPLLIPYTKAFHRMLYKIQDICINLFRSLFPLLYTREKRKRFLKTVDFIPNSIGVGGAFYTIFT